VSRLIDGFSTTERLLGGCVKKSLAQTVAVKAHRYCFYFIHAGRTVPFPYKDFAIVLSAR
jgi:hypothetical protein